jgi:hypothetical protein
MEILATLTPAYADILSHDALAFVAKLHRRFEPRRRELMAARFPSLRRKPKVLTEPEWRPSAARARTLLEDADRLAAAGRYGEAVRLILFRSIEDIDERWPGQVRPALTSRDISALEILPGSARQTFSGIARVVEHSLFGGRPVSAEGFAQCRGAYETFALSGRA